MDQSIFEEIKQINEYGKEYRQAIEFSEALWYKDFASFSSVVEKAKKACKNSGQWLDNHFWDFMEFSDAEEDAWQKSWKLSRYACYLVIQNADPSMELVALWQSYFALQVRKQELSLQSLEDQKRVQLRWEVAQHNKKLFSAAKWAWVSDYKKFYDYWYLWLYGKNKKDIIEQKGLSEKDNILDHMSSEELAANLFRATQAEAKIKREWIKGQEMASKAHMDVWQKIRDTIQELWWTMPEAIPAVDHIKNAKKRLKELAFTPKEKIEAPAILLRYPLPDSIDLIQALVSIIHTHPWDKKITIGESHYSVSQEGVWLIKTFFEKHI